MPRLLSAPGLSFAGSALQPAFYPGCNEPGPGNMYVINAPGAYTLTYSYAGLVWF